MKLTKERVETLQRVGEVWDETGKVRVLSVWHEGIEYRCQESAYEVSTGTQWVKSEWIALMGEVLDARVADELWDLDRRRGQDQERRLRRAALLAELWPDHREALGSRYAERCVVTFNWSEVGEGALFLGPDAYFDASIDERETLTQAVKGAWDRGFRLYVQSTPPAISPVCTNITQRGVAFAARTPIEDLDAAVGLDGYELYQPVVDIVERASK